MAYGYNSDEIPNINLGSHYDNGHISVPESTIMFDNKKINVIHEDEDEQFYLRFSSASTQQNNFELYIQDETEEIIQIKNPLADIIDVRITKKGFYKSDASYEIVCHAMDQHDYICLIESEPDEENDFELHFVIDFLKLKKNPGQETELIQRKIIKISDEFFDKLNDKLYKLFTDSDLPTVEHNSYNNAGLSNLYGNATNSKNASNEPNEPIMNVPNTSNSKNESNIPSVSTASNSKNASNASNINILNQILRREGIEPPNNSSNNNSSNNNSSNNNSSNNNTAIRTKKQTNPRKTRKQRNYKKTRKATKMNKKTRRNRK
jgi:hypothetical protein